jgi:hypothetical protein
MGRLSRVYTFSHAAVRCNQGVRALDTLERPEGRLSNSAEGATEQSYFMWHWAKPRFSRYCWWYSSAR